MRRVFILMLAFSSCIVTYQGAAHLLARAQYTIRESTSTDGVRIAPASGGAELQEIDIARRISLDAVKEADLTNMRVELWFPADWKKKEKGKLGLFNLTYLVHLQSLNPIEDDSGKLLSTKKRLEDIELLQGEVRVSKSKEARGKVGPMISLLLDAPAHRADKIKAIKGKAKVSVAKVVRITFKDLSAINGKILEHPDLKGLKAMKLSFSVEEKDGEVIAKLRAPEKYASPWNLGRLHDWDLMDGNQEIGLSSEGTDWDKDGFTVTKSYRRGIKGLSLHLAVLEPVETKTFDFNFRNVELP